MSTELALDVLRERAEQQRTALADCDQNAPWDVEACREALAETEALITLLAEFDRHDTAGPPCHDAEECWDLVAEKVEALEAVIVAGRVQ